MIISSERLMKEKYKGKKDALNECYAILEDLSRGFCLEGGIIEIKDILYDYREYVVALGKKHGWVFEIYQDENNYNIFYKLKYKPIEKELFFFYACQIL